MYTQLRRSPTNRILSGVAGGIAEAYGWDPTLVRIGFVVLTLFNGVGLLLYVGLWLVMQFGPNFAAANGEGGTALSPFTDRNRALGLILVVVGALLLADIFNIMGPVFALMLIGGGWYLLRHRSSM